MYKEGSLLLGLSVIFALFVITSSVQASHNTGQNCTVNTDCNMCHDTCIWAPYCGGSNQEIPGKCPASGGGGCCGAMFPVGGTCDPDNVKSYNPSDSFSYGGACRPLKEYGATGSFVSICKDGKDNDKDGVADCADTDCSSLSECQPTIRVTSPNGGETWTIGSTVTITWTSTNVNYVYLDLTNSAGGYSYGDSITNLVNVEGNPGQTSWTISTYAKAGTYKLKIGTCSTKTNRNDCSGSISDVYDYSDGTITLVAATTTTPSTCSSDSNCAVPNPSWAGATFCDGTGLKLMQYRQHPTCQSGTCIYTTSEQAVKEECSVSSKVCDFTTSGGGVYACVAGAPPTACPPNTLLTTRCICGSNYLDSYNLDHFPPHYCCGSGSNLNLVGGGACPTPSSTPSPTSIGSCTDSDGGQNYYVKGVGTGIYAGTIPTNHAIYGQEPGLPKSTTNNYSTYYDHCDSSGFDGNQLNEAYCSSDGKLYGFGYNCPYGCKDGVCISPPSPSPTSTASPTPNYTTISPSPTYSPSPTPTNIPTPSVSCNTDLDCAWTITNGCPESAGANWECRSLLKPLSGYAITGKQSAICPQAISPKPQANCGCIQNNCVPFPEAKKPTEPPRKIGHTDFDTTKLLSVIIQMEQLKVKFDFLKSATAKLALYYNATGNSDSFNKWLTATQMLENGIDKIENLKTEVRNKIDTFGVDDLRELKKEIKSVIGIIKDIVKTILAPPTTPIDASRLPPNQTQPTTPTPSLNQTQFVNQTNLTTPRPLSLSSKLIFVKKAVVQDQDIYLYDINTRSVTQLTSRYEHYPEWSPKGSYISYFSNNRNKTGTYIANSDGTNKRWIGDGALSWFANESRIAYSQREGESYVIYIATSQTPTTKERIVSGRGPKVSPDGSRILHITDNRLYITKLDTKAELLLAGAGIGRYYWSPDSSKVAYTVFTDGRHIVNIIKADGTNRISISVGLHAAGPSFVWSPSSTKLAYLKVNDSKTYVYVVNADGNRETQIGETMSISSSTQFPPMSWSLDGSKIVYSKYLISDNKLYLTIVNPDGTQETQLSSADSGKDPAWSPDGSKIAYTKTIGSKNYVFIINRDGTEDIRIAEGSEPQWQLTGG